MDREREHNYSLRLMQIVKRVHVLVENTDLEKHRRRQNRLGLILGNLRDVDYCEVDIDGIYGEWICTKNKNNELPEEKKIILHCHGGGYSTGSSLYARTLTSQLAAMTNLEVLSFDYRLSPEHVYPAAREDALKVWEYLLTRGYQPENIIVTGDSAGGNLALALALTLKEQGRELPCRLVLLSPWTDLTSSGESMLTKAELDPVLDREYIDKVIGAFAPDMDVSTPLISPLFGEFADFPPTYIQVGENEILLSDSLRLCEVMEKAGVDVTLEEFPGMWHVFQMAPIKTAADAMERVAEFIAGTAQ